MYCTEKAQKMKPWIKIILINGTQLRLQKFIITFPISKHLLVEGNQFYLNRRIDEIGSLQLYYGNKPLKVRNFIEKVDLVQFSSANTQVNQLY